jgi:dienelactone hydrolase
MDNVDRYEALLQRYRKPHTFVRYDGIGHGFLTFEDGTPASAPSQDAWGRSLTFLAEHLQPEGA